MTIQKKLLTIGIAASLLIAGFLISPKGMIGKSLNSAAVLTPVAIIDTGVPPSGTGIFGGLNFGTTNIGFTKQFTLTQTTTLTQTSLYVYASAVATGRSLTIAIYGNTETNMPNVSNERCLNRHILYDIPAAVGTWTTFSIPNCTLEPGTYWLAFEKRPEVRRLDNSIEFIADLPDGTYLWKSPTVYPVGNSMRFPTTGTGYVAEWLEGRGMKLQGTVSVLPTFTLTTTKSGAGTGTIASIPAGIDCGGDCNQAYDDGTSVVLTATANTGSTFNGWSGACTNTSGTCTVTMDAAKSVTANFTTIPTFALTTTTAGTGAGTINGNTSPYNVWSVATLTAVPALGSTFSGWTGACTNTSGQCTVTMDAVKSVTATFAGAEIAHYTFDNNFDDISGNGNNGTNTGSLYSAVNKKIGTHALEFDGVNDYSRAGTAASMNTVNNAVSISTWVYRPASQTGFRSIVQRTKSGGYLEYFLIGMENDKIVWLVNPTGGGNLHKIANSTSTIANNRWYHIVTTYDGANMKVYVDNVLETTLAATGAFPDDTQGLIFGSGDDLTTGAANPYGEFFKGAIDETRVYNYALNASEINSLYLQWSGAPDTTAPTVPTNVVSSGVTQTGATLSWTASTDAIGVTGYTIYRNGVEVGTSTTTTFTNTGLTASTTYSYTVKARDAANNISAASTAVSVTTLTAITVPWAPALVSATAGNAQVILSWNAPTSDGGSAVTEYIIEYKQDSEVVCSVFNGVISVTNRTATITGLTNNILYDFRVYAKNAIGESIASNELSTTPTTGVTSYTITFNKNDASATGTMSAQTLATGASASLTSNGFSKAGYVFAGWATSSTGAVVYANSASYTMGTTGIELFAKWTANNNTITFNKNDASATGTMSAQTLATGASASLTSNGFSKAGYVFAGWATSSTGAVVYANSASYTMGTTGIELFAKWTANNNTITFNKNDASATGTMSAQTLATGASASLTSNGFSKAGYVFAGWATSSTGAVVYANSASYTMGTTGIELFAKWTANNNTITFNKNDASATGTMSAQTLATGASASLTSNGFSKAGYVFAGWATSSTGAVVYANSASYTMGTTGIELFAKWVDSTAPSAPSRPVGVAQAGVTLSPSWDTITVAASVTSLSLNVTCTPGETVKLYNGTATTSLTSGVCTGSSKTVTFTLPSFADILYISATLTDIAGNESTSSLPVMVLKEWTTNPAPGKPDLRDSFDLGTYNTDDITSATQPQFSISCIDGNTVTLHEGNTLIGTGSCIANTTFITPTQILTNGIHQLVAKQTSSGNGNASDASGVLYVTIDNAAPTSPNTLVYSGTTQTGVNLSWTASSDATGISEYIVYRDGVQAGTTSGTSISDSGLTANTNYIYTVKARDTAGNISDNSNVAAVKTTAVVVGGGGSGGGGGGGGGGSGSAVNGQCSTTLKTFSTLTPSKTSLDDEKLCRVGTEWAVTYDASNLQWAYTCRGTGGGTTASCTVAASLNSAPTCTEKLTTKELPFNSCKLNSSSFITFHKYLSCLGVTSVKNTCADANCTQNANRQDLAAMAVRVRGIPLTSGYTCQKKHTDTINGTSSWVCEVVEKAQTAGLISATNKQFRPLDTITRAEAYSILLKSICIHPETNSQNWQTEVAKTAKKYGFTTRSVSDFEPNKQILRQELFVLTARTAEWKAKNPTSCGALPDALLCK